MQLIGVDFAQFLQLFQRRSGRNAGLGEKLLQNWRDWLFLFGSRDEFSRKIKWRIGTNTGDSDGVVFQHANCTLYKVQLACWKTTPSESPVLVPIRHFIFRENSSLLPKRNSQSLQFCSSFSPSPAFLPERLWNSCKNWAKSTPISCIFTQYLPQQLNFRTCLHKRIHVSFRQILLHTA